MDEDLQNQPIQETKKVDMKISGFKLYMLLVMILFIAGVFGIFLFVKNTHFGASGSTDGTQTSGDTNLTKFTVVEGARTPIPANNGPTVPSNTSKPTPTPKPSSKVLAATASPTSAPTASPTPSPTTLVPPPPPPPPPPPLSITCSGSPTTANLNKEITWTASPTNGSGSITYDWSGEASGSGQTAKMTYSTTGRKYVTVDATDSNQKTSSADCSLMISQ
jgi:hypothetical protein